MIDTITFNIFCFQIIMFLVMKNGMSYEWLNFTSNLDHLTTFSLYFLGEFPLLFKGKIRLWSGGACLWKIFSKLDSWFKFVVNYESFIIYCT